MWATALAFGSALSWGTADFVGGLKTRTLSVASVGLTCQLVGAALVCAVLPLVAAGAPAGRTVLYGTCAGIANAVGLTAFYRGLAVGRMSVVAPVAGLGVVVPVTVGLLNGEHPGAVRGAGILIAIVGVFLSTRHIDLRRGHDQRQSIALAVVAAAGIGGNLALIELAVHGSAASSVLWALLCSRLAAVAAIAAALACTKRPIALPAAADLPALVLLGAADVAANILYGLAVRTSLLSLAAVLASLHPAVTVVLARTMLAEKMRPVQQLGVALAIAGACLLSAS